MGAKLFPPRFPKTDIVFFAQFIEQSIVKCSVRVRCSFFDCLFITVFALPSLKFLWSFIQNVWRISLSVWALHDLLKLNIWPKLDFDLYMTLWPVDLWPFVWNLLCKLQVTFASFTLVWAFYTVSQKRKPLIIILANVVRFSKIFHQLIREKILYVHTIKDFHLICNMLLHNLVKFKNPKMLLNLHVEHDKKLLRLTEIYCEILRNLPQKYCTIDFT